MKAIARGAAISGQCRRSRLCLAARLTHHDIVAFDRATRLGRARACAATTTAAGEMPANSDQGRGRPAQAGKTGRECAAAITTGMASRSSASWRQGD
ncbi:MAG: hypothetical protein MZV65_52265 [Chromatiales bacterium]|nr:hypothetical protein [Chromatiales bacterium]